MPASVAAPPPDLSDLDKLSDNEVEELYFDAHDELRRGSKIMGCS